MTSVSHRDLVPPGTNRSQKIIDLTWRSAVMWMVLLASFITVLNYGWLRLNTLPPHWDSANHMISALKYKAVLSACVADLSSLTALKHCIGEIVYVDQFVYPPLFALTGGLFSYLAGTSIAGLAMTNVPFLVLLVASMYVMGAALHSRVAGVLAAMVVLAYPLVFQTSREFMLEFAMLAMTAAAAAVLIVSDRFRRAVPTLLFGVTLGLGVLTKFTFLTFLFGPAAFVLATLLVDVRQHRIEVTDLTRRLLVLACALVVGVVIAGVWYWPHRVGFVNALRTVTTLDPLNAHPLSPGALTFYADAMIRSQMGPPLFVLFMFGVWRCSTQLGRWSRNLLFLWIGSIYVIATVVTAKAVHHDLGILIPTALVSAIGVASLDRLRIPAVTLLTTFALLQFATLTLPEPLLGSRLGTFGWTGVVSPYPRTEDWQIEAALRSIESPTARVAVVSDHIFINGTVFQFYARQSGKSEGVSPCFRLGAENPEHADLSRFDVVVAKSDLAWIRRKADGCFKGPNGREEYAALLRRVGDPTEGFGVQRKFPLPDGSSLLVLKAERLADAR